MAVGSALHGVFVAGAIVCGAALLSAFLVPAGPSAGPRPRRDARRADRAREDSHGRRRAAARAPGPARPPCRLPRPSPCCRISRRLHQDPLHGPLFGVDEEGDAVVNALVPAVLQQFQEKAELTCYGALLEGLTGIWNAAVRTAVVAKLAGVRTAFRRSAPAAAGAVSYPGLRAEKGTWTREWLADPFTQDLAAGPAVRRPDALRPADDGGGARRPSSSRPPGC